MIIKSEKKKKIDTILLKRCIEDEIFEQYDDKKTIMTVK